jgi:adenine-specific DNA-methyltransferase
MSQKFEKLKTLLKELFQLDQPDLDFGLYRIMHAKSAEVTQFLDKDLLPQVKEAFGLYKTADKAELEKELAKAIEQAQSLGADPETLPKVKDLRAKLATDAVDIGGLENEVYDHLFSFFRRYYSEGDFLAKRVYRPGVYAIPYEGEEVKLHWANRDQYYIKTSEYLRDYAFRLRPDNANAPMRVHFRLVDAAEGEHGNVKPAEGKDRVFILAPEDFIAEEGGDLVLHFLYRPAGLTDWPESERQGKKKPPAQKDLTALAVGRILAVTNAAFTSWIKELARPHITVSGDTPGHSRLEGHLHRYTARNTFDYFIHKDLGGFLRRELDFYVKNEVMHLDDIESETATRVEQYLSKIKVIRRIAGKVIDFLAQLEDFQKKLWLKKKLVVDSQYCITLDRIPEEFYSEIAANDAQREEWVQLFAIDEIKSSLTEPGYTVPLESGFLKNNQYMMVDTRHFSESFTSKLLGSISDQTCGFNGVVFHGDNFHVLRLIEKLSSKSLNGLYLDPPYNTDASPIIYKNGYQHSSWACMFSDRMSIALRLIKQDGILCVAIDDFEYANLSSIMDGEFSLNHAGTAVVRSKPQGRPTAAGFSTNHEYAAFWSVSSSPNLGRLPRKGSKAERYPLKDEKGVYAWANFRKSGTDSDRSDRRKSFYPVYVKGTDVRVPHMNWDSSSEQWVDIEQAQPGEVAIWPIDSDGTDKVWTCSAARLRGELDDVRVSLSSGATIEIQKKYRPNQDGALPGTWWDSPEYSASESGTKVLKDLFGGKEFDFPKSINLVIDNLRVISADPSAIFMDYFGGSGTTASVIIELNREDGGSRKYLLAEQGEYFDTVLVPRIKKTAYSNQWREGKPAVRTSGVSHAFKVVRLESYEDALNNLVPRRTTKQDDLLALSEAQGADRLREQYMLRYMLDVETRGSQSLLNVKAFADPTAYKLKVKRPGSDESREVNVDLLETFNWLVGLTVQGIAAPQSFTAEFDRDVEGRLILKGRLRQDAYGLWWFRTITGTTPDGRRTLIIWRKLTGDAEQDNLVLDTWFKN